LLVALATWFVATDAENSAIDAGFVQGPLDADAQAMLRVPQDVHARPKSRLHAARVQFGVPHQTKLQASASAKMSRNR